MDRKEGDIKMSSIFAPISIISELRVMGIVLLRLLITGIVCSFIGMEREHLNRPAGIRTHVLVGIAAALIMCTSEYLFIKYEGLTEIDPTRMGAQVISGIGFLGAGTIIKEGFTVKGLTTAASLWAVACVGLAIGAGFYTGGVLAAFVIYGTLQILKNVRNRHAVNRTMHLQINEKYITLEDIKEQLEQASIYIQYVEIPIEAIGGEREYILNVYVQGNRRFAENALEKMADAKGVEVLIME